jgi:hypothetical protein
MDWDRGPTMDDCHGCAVSEDRKAPKREKRQVSLGGQDPIEVLKRLLGASPPSRDDPKKRPNPRSPRPS